METFLINGIISYFLFQIDFIWRANSLLFFIFITVHLLRYIHLSWLNKQLNISQWFIIWNIILWVLYIIFWQLLLDGINGYSFSEWKFFIYPFAYYSSFLIFLIPIIVLFQALFLRKKWIKWIRLFTFLISPSIYRLIFKV